MFTTDANLKAENEELKKELLKTKNKVRKLNEKCESYEDRLQGFVQDRAQLLDSLHVLESMKLEILANLTEEHNNTVLKNNQEIYSLKSRLDIAYTKLAESQYVINEFDNQGFWARIRNKKPEDLDEVSILKSADLNAAGSDVKSLEAGEESDSVDGESLEAGDESNSVDVVEDLDSVDGESLEAGEESDSVDGESLEVDSDSSDDVDYESLEAVSDSDADVDSKHLEE